MSDSRKDLIAEFTWGFSHEFYLETNEGNFIWSDPDYNGDNTICETNLSLMEWADPHNEGGFGRAKGKHRIGDYCGEKVVFTK